MCRTTRLAGLGAWLGDGEGLGLEARRAYLVVDRCVGGQGAGVGRIGAIVAVGTGIIAVDDGVDDCFGGEGGAVVVVLRDINDV